MTGEARLGPRHAGVPGVAFIVAIAAVYVVSRIHYFDLSGKIAWYVAAMLPLAALQVIHSTLPAGRRSRYIRFTLPLQALLTYAPYLYFGKMWMGLPAFLAGSMLILLPGRAAWAGFAAVAASAAAFGAAYGGGVEGTVTAVSSTVYTGVVLYGLSYLGGQVARVHGTREDMARLAVTGERLRASRDLGEALGGGLSAIARRSVAATTAPEVAGVVRVARRTLAGARTTAAAYRATARAADRSGDGGVGRLALAILLMVYAGYLYSGLTYYLSKPTGPAEWAVSFGSVVAIQALQLRHTVLWLRGRPVPGRHWTLAAQVVLAYFPVAVPGVIWPMAVGPAAASALLLLSGRTAWIASAVIMACAPAIGVLTSAPPGQVAWLAVSQVPVAIAVFGLIRLVELAGELRAARAELARMAVLAERLRVAGDVHDLLGYGLSAITLKAELAQRLLADDPERARAELAEVARLARRTLGELRDLIEGSRDLSLPDEISSAREVLAGLDVKVRVETAGEPPRREVEAALAAVLREAVTNVLRHSAARRVAIRVGGGRLEVVNDGVEQRAGKPGVGLGNMSARVESLGGALTTSAEDGRFRLAAEIPAEIPVP